MIDAKVGKEATILCTEELHSSLESLASGMENSGLGLAIF
jgi:hypothetical protein